MVELLEKTETFTEDFQGYSFYDERIVQEKFKLPYRKSTGKKNLPSYLYDSFLLSFYCLRDKRFREITLVIFKLVNKIAKKDIAAPLLLKDAFIELGSTFIKVGQFISSRPDLLPEDFTEVLSELQDSLPQIPFYDIKASIEKELRNPIEKIFKYISPECLASASIGQVHKAGLLNGQEVVLKIQRPNLKNLFYQDLAILRCLAAYFERYTELGKEREWVAIIDEIGKTLFEEINFIQEGRNADKFRKNLKYEERIYIPKIFWQFTTKKLITIEFVPGIKITDVDTLKQNNLDPKELARILVYAYFKQFFEDGFYHADPHPGNIVVKKDGTIVFYDFGMVARLNENVRKELASVLVSIIGNETDTLLRTLKKLELINSEADVRPIKRIIEQTAYSYYNGEKLNSLNINGLGEDLKKLINEKPMKLPSKFTYTLRMTGTLEGICRTLDPDFSLISIAKPYFYNWLKENPSLSKWSYLKALFPKQTKLIEKAKIYMEVIKELPAYVSKIENKNKEAEAQTENISPNLIQEENLVLKKEINSANSNLDLAYSMVVLLCFVLFGSFLVNLNDYITSTIGVVLLGFSLIGAIGIFTWPLYNKKMLE